jgi:hypothetical protein
MEWRSGEPGIESAGLLLVLFAAACAGRPEAPPIPAPSPSPLVSADMPAQQPPAPLPEAAPSASAPAPAPVPVWTPPLTFQRVLQVPVRWLSLGVSPYAAVLSEQPWVFDGRSWKELPLPAALRASPGERESLGIWFGRDDKARLMGARWDAGEANPSARSRPVYLRFQGGAWKRDPKEIGRLGSGPVAGMYGILGNDDPEVVCKVGDVCIIKRRTGWKTLPALPELARTWLCGETAFVLDAAGMWRLEQSGFARVPWEFEGRGKETAFWADTPGSWWVAAAGTDALYRYDGRAWSSVPSPVRAPAGLWASSPSDVWVVGDSGAGHFDGTSWSRVQGLSMPLGHVTGRGSDEVWVGGPEGVWRGGK